MAKDEKGELVVVQPGFDYTPLAAKTANKVKDAADRIRQTVKRTIEDIIEVGNELLTVKEALTHGQFSPWLRALGAIAFGICLLLARLFKDNRSWQ